MVDDGEFGQKLMDFRNLTRVILQKDKEQSAAKAAQAQRIGKVRGAGFKKLTGKTKLRKQTLVREFPKS